MLNFKSRFFCGTWVYRIPFFCLFDQVLGPKFGLPERILSPLLSDGSVIFAKGVKFK